jgi:RNA polymerase sigma-70 factor (ECF subfamily)
VEDIHAAYEASGAALLAYAAVLSGSREAGEDALHEVFVRILRRRPPVSDWRPYLFRAVRNACMDGRRDAKRRENGKARLFAEAADAVDAAERLVLEEALAQLTANQRECIVLKVYGGFTLKEIAAVCGVPPNTAGSWYRRGLDKLRQLLEVQDDE